MSDCDFKFGSSSHSFIDSLIVNKAVGSLKRDSPDIFKYGSVKDH